MSGRFSFIIILVALFLSSSIAGCGILESETPHALARAVAKGSGPFNGVWKLTLKPTKDTCDLGLSKSVKTSVTIVQNGSKVSLTLEGLPKYSGTITGNKLVASGKYNASGVKTNGSVSATLSKNKKTLSVSNAKINVKTSKVTCYVTFSGNGKK